MKTAIAMARAAGGSVILAGDWNAVQQTSDRQPSAHLESNRQDVYDTPCCDGLQSVFALPDGSLPTASRMPSYERDCKQGNSQELMNLFVLAGVGYQSLPPPWSSQRC